MNCKFVCDRCTVKGVKIPQQVVNVVCDSIPEGRRQASDHVAGRYKVPVAPVLAKVRLAFVDSGVALCRPGPVDRALAASGTR